VIIVDDIAAHLSTWRRDVSHPDYELEKAVRSILEAVAKHGDTAIREFTHQFDQVSIDTLQLLPLVDVGRDAARKVPPALKTAIDRSIMRIERFARAQLAQLAQFELEVEPGFLLGQTIRPLDSVGVYVPGGRYPLFSTALMGVIPARIAGVPRIVVVTPPSRSGQPDDATLYAAVAAGASEIYRIGGAQAIGALAYGSDSVRRVDKIVGPGNRFVTFAKQVVSEQVAIDMLAGPSELLVIADDQADPAAVAADLLAQAEHDVDARVFLLASTQKLLEKVESIARDQLQRLPTRAVAEQAWTHALGGVFSRLSDAAELTNRIAPEHLQLYIKNQSDLSVLIAKLNNFGSLFIGAAAEVFADYSSGLNHILPTAGQARRRGGVSVFDFVKILTYQRVRDRVSSMIAADAEQMALSEGLIAHARAASRHRQAY